MIADKIRKIAEDQNVAVFGICSTTAMANEHPGHRPEDLLPGARSLICFGIPIPKDVYRMINYSIETVWRSQNLNYRLLDTLSLRFANLLEENGFKAVPIYGCQPMGLNEKGVVGYLNQLRMGEVTGVGIIGKNGLLLHSRYGSRLMLGGVITTAELPVIHYPDTSEPGCPPECRICAEACPVQAIIAEKKQVKIMRCLGYTAQTPLMSRLRFLFLKRFKPLKGTRYMNMTSFDEHTFHICSRCVSLCPYGEVN